MKLIDSQTILDRLSLGDKGQNREAVESSIDGATQTIAGVLDTPLAAAERIDYFSCPCNDRTAYAAGRIRLYLNHSMLDLTTFAVYLITSNTLLDLTDLPDEAEAFPDPEHGLVTLMTQPSQAAINIAVHYTAGFSEDANGVAENTPDWLKEAAVQETIRLMYANGQRFNTIDRRDRIGDVLRASQAILDDHHRPRVGYIFPQSSMAVTP